MTKVLASPDLEYRSGGVLK